MSNVKLNPGVIQEVMNLVSELVEDNKGEITKRSENLLEIKNGLCEIQFLEDGFELYSNLETEDEGHLAGFYYLSDDPQDCAINVHDEAISHVQHLF
jgi:hypothetical protein